MLPIRGWFLVWDPLDTPLNSQCFFCGTQAASLVRGLNNHNPIIEVRTDRNWDGRQLITETDTNTHITQVQKGNFMSLAEMLASSSIKVP
jgi:hypothetical protein